MERFSFLVSLLAIFSLMFSCSRSVEQVTGPIQYQSDKIVFKEVPALKGVELAVLEGDPKSSGLYTIRLKAPAGFTINAHTHSGHERVTVLAGSITVAFAGGKPASRRFTVGDYYVNPAGVVHTIAAGPDGVMVQVTGIGPWQTILVKAQQGH